MTPNASLPYAVQLGLLAAGEILDKLLKNPSFPDSERHRTAVTLDLVARGMRSRVVGDSAERAINEAWLRLHALLRNVEFPKTERAETASALDLVTQALDWLHAREN